MQTHDESVPRRGLSGFRTALVHGGIVAAALIAWLRVPAGDGANLRVALWGVIALLTIVNTGVASIPANRNASWKLSLAASLSAALGAVLFVLDAMMPRAVFLYAGVGAMVGAVAIMLLGRRNQSR